MPKEQKVELVRQIREDVEKSVALFITDYRGLTVSEITDLRKKLRESKTDYKVVKNTLLSLAMELSADAELTALLTGPTAVAFVRDEPIAPAKTLVDFARIHKTISIKGGYIDGMVYDPKQIQTLSTVPPKEMLLSQMLGAMKSPITNFVGSLQGVLSNFVFTLQAVADKKEA